MSADEREIYKQDCESFRYEDKTFWSRFQTLIVIEGAAIGVILTNTIIGVPGIILAFGTLFVSILISLLALKDREDSIKFIIRISKYEKSKNVTPIRPPKKVVPWNLNIRRKGKRIHIWRLDITFNSLIFSKWVFGLLILLNVILVIFSFFTL